MNVIDKQYISQNKKLNKQEILNFYLLYILLFSSLLLIAFENACNTKKHLSFKIIVAVDHYLDDWPIVSLRLIFRFTIIERQQIDYYCITPKMMKLNNT